MMAKNCDYVQRFGHRHTMLSWSEIVSGHGHARATGVWHHFVTIQKGSSNNGMIATVGQEAEMPIVGWMGIVRLCCIWMDSDVAHHLCDSERGVWGCALFQFMFYFER